jgi:hypothetical protein
MWEAAAAVPVQRDAARSLGAALAASRPNAET